MHSCWCIFMPTLFSNCPSPLISFLNFLIKKNTYKNKNSQSALGLMLLFTCSLSLRNLSINMGLRVAAFVGSTCFFRYQMSGPASLDSTKINMRSEKGERRSKSPRILGKMKNWRKKKKTMFNYLFSILDISTFSAHITNKPSFLNLHKALTNFLSDGYVVGL